MSTRWLILKKQQLLLSPEGFEVPVLRDAEIASFKDKLSCIQDVGQFQNESYRAAHYDGDAEALGPYVFKDLRRFFTHVDPQLFTFLGKAMQLTHWLRTTRYCGVCGAETVAKEDERARICPQCSQLYFPRISPAVICAVIRGDEVLLARSTTVPYNMYSILAGFVEPGETLEECVVREVKEEVGLEVGNIRYFGSQPWSFPDSLMVGFTAEYVSGEIVTDDKEIVEAKWFKRNALPENIPAPRSIAGRILAACRESPPPA